MKRVEERERNCDEWGKEREKKKREKEGEEGEEGDEGER